MKNIVFILIVSLGLYSCKRDKFSHEDRDYLYYWIYKIDGDSVLKQFHKPRTVEYRVSGGRHRTNAKNKTHKIYIYKDDRYQSFPIRGSNRCEIVDRARSAEKHGEILIGIFQESFYPSHKLEFIGYK